MELQRHSQAVLSKQPDGSAAGGTDVTRLIRLHQSGSKQAIGELLTKLYPEFRRIAARINAGNKGDNTLGNTALLHEGLIRLMRQDPSNWRGSEHLMALAATVIRHAMVDYARTKLTQKRSAEGFVDLDNDLHAQEQTELCDLLAIDQGLHHLAQKNEQTARVFECRYFYGLSTDETAKAMNMSVRSTERAWQAAKSHLRRLLSSTK